MSKKTTIYVAILGILMLFQTNLILAQTGIFYYPTPTKLFNNNKILSITEAPNKEIYLLGKLSNTTYDKSIPYFCRTNKNGILLFNKALDKFNIYDLNKIMILQNQYVKIFGSKKQGPIFAPWWITTNSQGSTKKNKGTYVVYSTTLNDVCDIDGENIILAETKVDNSKLYNINLLHVNGISDKTLWSKNIKSDKNEEASKIIKLKDGNLLVLGKTYSDNFEDYFAIVYKIDKSGKALWRRKLKTPNNFFSQDITENNQGNLIYVCSYSKKYMSTTETLILKLNSNGKQIKKSKVENINSNGVIVQSNDNLVVYGSNLQVIKNKVVTKGKYVIVNSKLDKIYEYELSEKDKPDNEMPKDIAVNLPTNSDFTTGIILSNGRIAIAGKINMPSTPKTASPYGNDRNNEALLLIMDSNGKF